MYQIINKIGTYEFLISIHAHTFAHILFAQSYTNDFDKIFETNCY